MLFCAIPLTQAMAETIRVAGDWRGVDFALKSGKLFQQKEPAVLISGEKADAHKAFSSLLAGECDIVISKRKMSAKEEKLFAAQKVRVSNQLLAYAAVEVIVNPLNNVEKLTADQFRDIFSGKTIDWQAVGGVSSEITPLVYDDSLATLVRVLLFGEAGADYGRRIIKLKSSQELISQISENPSAVTFITGRPPRGTKLVKLDGTNLPSVELYLYSREDRTETLKRFIAFLGSDEVSSLLSQCGLSGPPAPNPPTEEKTE